MKKLGFAALAAVLALSFSSPVMARKYVYIKNGSNRQITFLLRIGSRGRWKRFKIYPNQRKRYYDTSGRRRRIEVKIKTRGRGYVRYSLYHGHSYKIKWSKRKGVWDVVKVY